MGDVTLQTRTQAPDPEDTAAEERKTFLGLSLTQIAGSALAAVTAAVAASFLGVAGTLIGAALGSVVSSVAGAAYATSLKTATTRVRTTRTVVVRPGPDGVRGASQTDPARVPSGFGAPPVPLARTRSVPIGAADGATAYRSAPAWRRLSWKPVAVVTALGFVLGIGALTMTEGLLGHPLSSSASTGTTVGDVVGGSSQKRTPAPSTSPAATPSATPTTTATGTPSPATTGTPSDPATGTATPSAPATPAPTSSDPAAPVTSTPDAPAPTTGAATP